MFDRADKGLWWDEGINLVEGCTRVSPGCDNCWALAAHKRYGVDPSKVVFRADRLPRLAAGKKPKVKAIWNDLFHPRVASHAVDDVMVEIGRANHLFVICTKRIEDAATYLNEYDPIEYDVEELQEKIIIMTTVENTNSIGRLSALREIHDGGWRTAISAEPLLGPLDLTGCGWLDWVVAGGETGPKARPCNKDWIHSLAMQCAVMGVPFFFKQYGKNSETKNPLLAVTEKYISLPRQFPKGGEACLRGE